MRLVILALLAIAPAMAQGNAVFKQVFKDQATAAASNPVPNSGQAVHMLTVLIPTATADVSDFVIRLEGSYDGTVWFPISADMTSAKYTGAFAYGINRANGVYPSVRVRLVTASAKPITAYYTGGQYPIGQVMLNGDRYIVQSPGGGGAPPAATWGLCVGADCVTKGGVAVQWIATQQARWKRCYIAARIAPTGAAVIVDLRKNGIPIFASSARPTLAAGSSYAIHEQFNDAAIAEGDLFSLDIVQVGSTQPGRDLTFTCVAQ